MREADVTKEEEDKLWLAERIELYKYAERTAYERYLRNGAIFTQGSEESARYYTERNLYAIMERDFNESLD